MLFDRKKIAAAGVLAALALTSSGCGRRVAGPTLLPRIDVARLLKEPGADTAEDEQSAEQYVNEQIDRERRQQLAAEPQSPETLLASASESKPGWKDRLLPKHETLAGDADFGHDPFLDDLDDLMADDPATARPILPDPETATDVAAHTQPNPEDLFGDLSTVNAEAFADAADANDASLDDFSDVLGAVASAPRTKRRPSAVEPLHTTSEKPEKPQTAHGAGDSRVMEFDQLFAGASDGAEPLDEHVVTAMRQPTDITSRPPMPEISPGDSSRQPVTADDFGQFGGFDEPAAAPEVASAPATKSPVAAAADSAFDGLPANSGPDEFGDDPFAASPSSVANNAEADASFGKEDDFGPHDNFGGNEPPPVTEPSRLAASSAPRVVANRPMSVPGAMEVDPFAEPELEAVPPPAPIPAEAPSRATGRQFSVNQQLAFPDFDLNRPRVPVRQVSQTAVSALPEVRWDGYQDQEATADTVSQAPREWTAWFLIGGAALIILLLFGPSRRP